MSVIRSEQIDTRALLDGDPGDANFTDAEIRLDERARVLAYWPPELIEPIRQGIVEAPPWRLLLDPTAWADVSREDVADYVYDFLERGRWPSIDGIRRRFGRVSNHRGPDENPAQDALL